MHNGNLGGLSGADQICQSLADNAPTPLPGSYKAWLSIGSGPRESPATGRFRQSRQPYTLVDGTTVADNWADLISGSINTPLNVNELGNAVRATDIVWTNTLPDGASGGRESFQACDASSFSHNCAGWTTTSSLELGDLGLVGAPNCSWTAHSKSGCFTDASRHLYCFQQD